MSYILKALVWFLRELIFDNKEEYDIRSSKFNIRKVTILILIISSFLLNAWLLHRFVSVAVQLVECRTASVQSPPDHQPISPRTKTNPNFTFTVKNP